MAEADCLDGAVVVTDYPTDLGQRPGFREALQIGLQSTEHYKNPRHDEFRLAELQTPFLSSSFSLPDIGYERYYIYHHLLRIFACKGAGTCRGQHDLRIVRMAPQLLEVLSKAPISEMSDADYAKILQAADKPTAGASELVEKNLLKRKPP
eukprot:GSA25T00004878001.1